MGKLHFGSKSGYQKWLAYNWIHNKQEMGKPPHEIVYVHGKEHKVKHKGR